MSTSNISALFAARLIKAKENKSIQKHPFRMKSHRRTHRRNADYCCRLRQERTCCTQIPLLTKLRGSLGRETCAKGLAGFAPRMNPNASLQQRNVQTGKQTALRNRVIGSGCAQRINLEFVASPKPDFRHLESAINIKLPDAAARQSDFEHQVRKFLLLANTP